jgi:type VI secretion system FHA domain protein
VHDFNLPLRAMPAPAPSLMPAMPPMPAPAPLPMAFGDAADPLAALDALAAPAAPAAGGAPDDPWVDFAKDWVPASSARKEKPPAFPPAGAAPINHAFDDAFSSSTSWRVEDMPVPDPLASASFQADSLIGAAFALPESDAPGPGGAPRQDQAASNAAALRALCRGLGITAPPQINDRDWEKLGNSIRQIVQGLSDLMNVRAELKKEMRAADRTMLGAQENNPLKSGMPLEELLHYLLFMPQGAAGYMPVNRALDESITDLRAHEFASLAAVRAAVEGSIREFDPARLRTTLLKGKRSIATALDNARLWDLYSAHYEQKGLHMADWLEQVFNRHFMPAYTREAERLRRESQLPADQPPRTF